MTQTHNKDCACCGFPTLPDDSIFEICPLCGWQDDALQNSDPDYSGGANELSLNDYRRKWFESHKRTEHVLKVA
jgi:hypothetical protein